MTKLPSSYLFDLKSLALALAVLFVNPVLVRANPEGGEVVAGNATINTDHKSVVIKQNSAKTIINWQNFNIDADEITQFIQPSSNSVALNRILGKTPSTILRRLAANGNLITLNSAGILFGLQLI